MVLPPCVDVRSPHPPVAATVADADLPGRSPTCDYRVNGFRHFIRTWAAAANRRSPMLLLLLYYRRGSKNARAANGFSGQQRNGHWEINCTFRTVSVPPFLSEYVGYTFASWVGRNTSASTRVGRCAYTVFEKHKSYACCTGSII